jgi:hypothetical protein
MPQVNKRKRLCREIRAVERGNNNAGEADLTDDGLSDANVSPTKSTKRAQTDDAASAQSRTKLVLLNDVERLLRLRAQAQVVKALRRTVRGLRQRVEAADAKRSRILTEEEAAVFTPRFRREFLLAQQRLNEHKFELPDQRNLLATVVRAIAHEHIDLSSIAFDVICTQLRPTTLKNENLSGMRSVVFCARLILTRKLSA